MMKKLFCISPMLIMLFTLSGCTIIGNKNTSISIIYASTAVVALILLIGYCFLIKKKEKWFLLLFASVFIVNTGYFSLSVSPTLESALISNRISYLGSVFLPLSMIMTILNLSKFKYKKSLPAILFTITSIVFLIAASPGYIDIYYKSVTLEHINGISVLKKEYGPWHCIYLYYLLTYFSLMVGTTIHAVITKKIKSGVQAIIILIAVFVNICVWLLEQLADVNFEFLSVSYIISELFLIGVYLMIQDMENKLSVPPEQPQSENSETKPVIMSDSYIEKCRYLEKNISSLTTTERIIYNLHLEEKSTKTIMQEMNITENTLKFHNKNIYGKLGVTSRKQLREYTKALEILNSN